jgi:hypothetical protein
MAGMKLPSQFSLRTLLEVIAVAAFICALIYARNPSANSAGRYQLIYTPTNNAIIFDTQTGKSLTHISGSGVFNPDDPFK